jgi:signal transduction histidine kinase
MASLGTLVSGVAHEINNPIATVLLNAPIVEKVWHSTAPILDEHCSRSGSLKIGGMEYTQLSARMPQLLSSISDSARRVKKIVGDLKDFARQSPSEMNDRVDINSAVEKAIGLVSSLIKKSTEHFSVDYHAKLPVICGNTQRIEQVVVNLLVNACQALPDKERSIRVATDFDAAEGILSIRVVDQGIGIPADTAKRIKDPFFTTKRDTGGTGLGLSISDRIVQDHGGTMEFFSEVDRGTTVNVSIPVNSKATLQNGEPV